ncbi:MAG TPA: ThuA domain-containing protein [Steroidobacteraceae bacterium]|jgi:hypothetical protein
MTLKARISVGIALVFALAIAPAWCADGPGSGSSPAHGPGNMIGAGKGRAVERRPGKKNVLAWIDSRSAMESHAAAVIERLGHDSGLYDTYIRADATGAPDRSELEAFDVIFFLGSRGDDLTSQQQADLLTFVRNGKGFVGGHAASDGFPSWAEFGEMLGGRLEEHPWGKTDTTLVIEDPTFPGMQGLPRLLATHDETYEIRDLSRADVDVLIRLDVRHLDMTKPKRKDGDFPMAWAKMYGQGRVYYNALGHEVDAWDNPAFQRMYFEAMKWTLGLTPAKIAPHSLVEVAGSPKPLK